jgi:DNA-binding transcriptional regulator YdaS (Cro superfamily)
MNTLRTYLNSLATQEQEAYCVRCGTSIGYLRKAISIGQRLGADLCIALERESNSQVRCEDLRPDVDWAYLRASDVATIKDSLTAQKLGAGKTGKKLKKAA